jgi:hypothetical protein
MKRREAAAQEFGRTVSFLHHQQQDYRLHKTVEMAHGTGAGIVLSAPGAPSGHFHLRLPGVHCIYMQVLLFLDLAVFGGPFFRGLSPRVRARVDGVVIVPATLTVEILKAAEEIYEREAKMRAELRQGLSIQSAFEKYGAL